MTTTKKIIRTTDDAREYLAENAPHALEMVTEHEKLGPVIVESAACYRCGGSGYGHWYVEGGRCFECGGVDTSKRTRTTTLKRYAQAHKRKATARARATEARKVKAEARLDRQRDWNEEHGNGRLTFAELDAKRIEEREAARLVEAAKSEYVGEVKQRREFDLTVTFRTTFEGHYGTTYLYSFKDASENVLVWFKSNEPIIPGDGSPAIDTGDTIRLKATIKEHKEYKNVRQTVLTRGALVEVLGRNNNEEE